VAAVEVEAGAVELVPTGSYGRFSSAAEEVEAGEAGEAPAEEARVGEVEVTAVAVTLAASAEVGTSAAVEEAIVGR
jgi:hypothetical protein